jgi:hypothetical protein
MASAGLAGEVGVGATVLPVVPCTNAVSLTGFVVAVDVAEVVEFVLLHAASDKPKTIKHRDLFIEQY